MNNFSTDTEKEKKEYQVFLAQLKIQNQEETRKSIFSPNSKEIYESALATLTNEPQSFSVLKPIINKATKLDESWCILTDLVQAGLARMDEISFEMSGAKIKKNVKYSFQLA